MHYNNPCKLFYLAKVGKPYEIISKLLEVSLRSIPIFLSKHNTNAYLARVLLHNWYHWLLLQSVLSLCINLLYFSSRHGYGDSNLWPSCSWVSRHPIFLSWSQQKLYYCNRNRWVSQLSKPNYKKLSPPHTFSNLSTHSHNFREISHYWVLILLLFCSLAQLGYNPAGKGSNCPDCYNNYPWGPILLLCYIIE